MLLNDFLNTVILCLEGRGEGLILANSTLNKNDNYNSLIVYILIIDIISFTFNR